MAFYGYKGDASECHWTPYSSSSYEYDALPPPQASVAYSSYEFNEPRLLGHSPYNYFDSYTTQPVQNYSAYNLDSYTTQPVQNYSVYNLSEPRFIQYEPPPSFVVDSFFSQTNKTTSYSTLEFNEPEWEEFDPTPYGGGYDPAQTYGKPLPPSDEICYPRSTAQPNNELLDGFSYASIPSAYGEKDDRSMNPDNGSKPADSKEKPNGEFLDDHSMRIDNGNKPADSEEKESIDVTRDNVPSGTENGEDETIEKPLEEKSRDVNIDEYPSSDYGRIGGYDYGWNRQVPYIPYGSGLESLDLCESIFGYWPCLAKMERQRKVKREVGDEESSRYDPWKSTADYLFGSPFVYSDQKDGGNGNYYGSGSYYQYEHEH